MLKVFFMENHLNRNSLFDYQGVYNISDDAPIFPTGQGWENSLFNLLTYPKGKELFEIETIGNILTILSNTRIDNSQSNIWNDCNMYVAIYVDDLIELFNLEYVSGIKPITEFRYDLNQFNRLLQNGFKLNNNGDIVTHVELPDGKTEKHIIVKPKIEKYVSDYLGEDWNEEYMQNLIRDYESGNKPFIEISKSIVVTEKGFAKYLELSQNFEIPERIKKMVEPLIKIEYYATAIREVAILIEDTIRKFHNIKSMGWKLIQYHINKCIEANEMNNNAGIKIYRHELITANSFIRNEFIHNLVDVDKENFYAILYRQCYLYRLMEQAFDKLLEKNTAN
jgi:hypothetical protein